MRASIEKKIMALFESGLGGYTIAKRLHRTPYSVFKVMHKHGFRRKDGNGFADPKADVQGFIEAIKRRDDHIWNLAEKYRIGKVKAFRLAHQILKTHLFRPGASKPPLSSAFPQKHWGPKVGKSVNHA